MRFADTNSWLRYLTNQLRTRMDRSGRYCLNLFHQLIRGRRFDRGLSSVCGDVPACTRCVHMPRKMHKKSQAPWFSQAVGRGPCLSSSTVRQHCICHIRNSGSSASHANIAATLLVLFGSGLRIKRVVVPSAVDVEGYAEGQITHSTH